MAQGVGNAGLQTVRVFGYSVLNEDARKIEISGPPRVVNTISPNSYGIATRDPAFRDALRGADYLALDGVYFGLAAVLLRGCRLRVNNGPFLFRSLLERLDVVGGKAFLLGSSEGTLRKMAARAGSEFPNVRIDWHAPPFKVEFSEDDNLRMIDAIEQFVPDVVFVGMTAPKQEKWSYQNGKRIRAGLIVSVGAVFDWYAGNEREIRSIWWRLHLGWLVRTIGRPEILKRYPNVAVFFWHLFLAMLRLRREET